MKTQKQIVIESIKHKNSNIIPYNIEFTIDAYKKMSNYYGDENFINDLNNFLVVLKAEPENSFIEIAPNIYRDYFGVEWNRTVDKDIGVVCNTLVNKDNIKDFTFPAPNNPSIYKKFYDEIPENNDKFIVASLGFSLFERAWTLAGMENVLISMAIEKDFINDLLDRILEYNLKVIENCCKFEIDAMIFGDDWGEQKGIIMGPKTWREFIKPRVKQMYEKVKSFGKFVFIHSCGKVDELFPDLIECGVDVFNPFQPEVIDIIDAKKKYGNYLTFYGGISTQHTLPFGTTEDIKNEVISLLKNVGKNGGLIAAPSHAIPGDAKPENIDVMIEILKNQNKYL